MLLSIVGIVLVIAVSLLLWRGWLKLFPGLSLRANYGIVGGWFGTPVRFKGVDGGSSPSWWKQRPNAAG